MRRMRTSLLATDQEEHTSLISAALITRVASGDESAFATLYDMTCGLIYGLLLRILGNSETAKQILVDVYKEAWEQAATYDDGEHDKPIIWLITMARSCAIARLRADDQEQVCQTCPLIVAEGTMTISSKTDGMILDEQRIVRSAFATLSLAQQQMIELAYFSGLRQKEIAARLGLSLQSVQTEMRVGMTRLRNALTHSGSVAG